MYANTNTMFPIEIHRIVFVYEYKYIRITIEYPRVWSKGRLCSSTTSVNCFLYLPKKNI